MTQTIDTTKSANITVTLKTDSGYEAKMDSRRIIPEQWGRIVLL